MASSSAKSVQASSRGIAFSGQYSILFLLFILNTVNFVDRALISSFANFIVPDLGLTNTQYGILTGVGFLVIYGLAGLVAGALADRMERPLLMGIAVGFWSLMVGITGFARGFVGIAIPRFFVGAGEAALSPAALSLLGDVFPREKLGRATSVYYLASPVGAGISLVLAGSFGAQIGWRGAFWALGVTGFLLAMLALLLPEPRRGKRQASATMRGHVAALVPSLRGAARTVWGTPALRYIVLGCALTHVVLGALVFDQLWLVQERGFERSEIARLTGAMLVVAGIAGTIAGGYGSDLAKKYLKMERASFLFWGALPFVPFTYIYRFASPDSSWFWVAMFVGSFQLGSYLGPIFAAIQELSPPDQRSKIIAICILANQILGLSVGSLVGGVSVDFLVSREVANPYTVVLVTATVISQFAIVPYLLASRNAKRDAQARVG